MSIRTWWQGLTAGPEVMETAPAKVPEREGFAYGIGPSGLTETNQGVGAGQGDRRAVLSQLYEAYLACPWAWASVNAIARTITAGGLVMDWDNTDGQDEQDEPAKPPQVKALERMLAFSNPTQGIRQILRNVIIDLEVFADAYLEIVWIGNQPVALYNLDSPTMTPLADEHGTITGYVQVTELGQRAEFDVRDVIHFSLDAPRSSVFGVSPTQAAQLPIASWLFASATSKEIFRKGAPPTIHVDFPAGASGAEISRWNAQYQQRNVGPRNIGTPISTKGGATVNELAQSRTMDYLKYLDQKRDEIIAAYGVPPAKVGIIESGNIGGGSGESQDRTFMVNTCQPLAELVLEKLNYHLAKLGFGIEGWKLKFNDVDMRDSKTIEEIRDLRLHNGSWTLNRYKADIGEPPVEGGDDAVLVNRSEVVQWRDMDALSKAAIASKLKGTALEPGEPVAGEASAVVKPEPAPVPPQLAPFAGGAPPADEAPPEDAPPAESHKVRYRRRLAEALATLGGVDERAA